MISTKHGTVYTFLLCISLSFAITYPEQNELFSNVKTMEQDMDITGWVTPEKGTRTMDLFDDMDNFEDSVAIDDFFDTVSLDPAASRKIEAKNILGFLESIGAFTVLDQDFYKRTNPFAQRNILDLPLWELHSCTEPKHWIVGAHAFWNHMDRSVFVCKNTNIDSYINFDQTILFEKLNEIPPEIKAALPNPSLIDDLLDLTNIDRLLSLFRNFTIQQRRLGAMLHAWRQWQRFEIRMLLPIYYLERNMFAHKAAQAALEEEFGAADPDTQEKLQENFLISDKFGVGDFRFEADYAVYQSEDFTLRVGALTTLPIAFAIKKGIKGS